MDPNEVLKKLPGESDEEIQLNVSQVVLQQLQNMRNQEERPRMRRKRVQVQPGKVLHLLTFKVTKRKSRKFNNLAHQMKETLVTKAMLKAMPRKSMKMLIQI